MFPDIALNSAHPFSRYIEFTFEPAQACAEAAGLISLVPNDPSSSPISDGRFDPFLPPDRLLRALDKTFAEMLSARTSTAMENIVSMVREYCDDDDDKAEEVCENMRVEDILGRLTAWQMWVPRSLADQMKLAEMQKEMEAEGEVDYEGEETEEDLEGTIEEVPTSRSGSPRVELVEGGEEEVHFTPVEVPPSDDYQPSPPPSSSSPPLTLTLGKRKSTDVFPEPTDKRARPSTSPNEREWKLEQLPQTPRKQILSLDDTSGGLAVDTSASAAVVASDGGGAGGGGGLKRKEPPSPAVNHIDKGRKEVTPPPGPKFDLADGHGHYGDKRTRVTGDLVQEASSAPVSSLPGSPTPMKKRVGGGGGGEEEEGGGLEVDVETEEMSRRGTSVTETVGTVPVTPEEGMSLGGETVIDPKLVSMDPEGSDVDDPQAQSVQTIDNPPLVELVTPSPSPSLSTFPARSRSPSTVSAADSYSSGSSSIPLDGDGDGDGTLTPLTSATARLARYVQRAHASTPFIPLPVCRLLPHPDHPAHPNQGGQGVQLPVNLGEGANRVLLNTWYEARGELRECKCRICERARRKAWESLEAMRQLVASGEVTWETLLS